MESARQPHIAWPKGATTWFAQDRDLAAARQVASSVEENSAVTLGRAGTGISDCGRVIGVDLDITDRAQVRRAMAQTVLAFGGLDHLVITAGVYVSSDSNGDIPDDSWQRTFGVNVIGPYLAADEAKSIWEAQGLEGSLVITTSVNAMVAKAGSLAYDASKAAANHLVRELSIELAPIVTSTPWLRPPSSRSRPCSPVTA